MLIFVNKDVFTCKSIFYWFILANILIFNYKINKRNKHTGNCMKWSLLLWCVDTLNFEFSVSDFTYFTLRNVSTWMVRVIHNSQTNRYYPGIFCLRSQRETVHFCDDHFLFSSCQSNLSISVKISTLENLSDKKSLSAIVTNGVRINSTLNPL